MAFTGVLGKVSLGDFALGRTGSSTPVSPLEPSVISDLNLTQSVTLNKTLNLPATNTLTFSQVALKVTLENLNDTLTFSDSVEFVSGKFVYSNNALALSQSVTNSIEAIRVTSQALPLTQRLQKNLVKAISISHNLFLTQTIAVSNAKAAYTTITFSQVADVVLSKRATNAFNVTQHVTLNTVLSRSLNTIFSVFQSVHSGPNTFRRALSNTIAFSQDATGINVKGIQQNLTFTQSVVVNKVRGTTNTLTLAQNASYTAVFFRANNPQVLVLQELIVLKKVKTVQASNILAFEQQAKKLHIKHGAGSNTLNLSQELVNSRFIKTLTNTIDFDQSLAVTKIIRKSASNIIHFVHSVGLTKVTNLHISQTIDFNKFHKKPIRFEAHDVSDLMLPPAMVVTVEPFVLLKGLHRAITLPQPEFNDSDAFAGTINILRSKTGVRRVYKKSTDRRILDYTFIMQSKKYEELKDFIREYNNLPFYLQNWRGELYFVLFNSNPFSFSEDAYWEENDFTGKNKFTVNLTFEGVRLN